jgi:hypothetical protein
MKGDVWLCGSRYAMLAGRAAELGSRAPLHVIRVAGGDLQTETGTDPGTGKPTLAWRFDQEAIDAEAATDGWYAPARQPGSR